MNTFGPKFFWFSCLGWKVLLWQFLKKAHVALFNPCIEIKLMYNDFEWKWALFMSIGAEKWSSCKTLKERTRSKANTMSLLLKCRVASINFVTTNTEYLGRCSLVSGHCRFLMHKKFLRRFYTIFGLKMMMKSGLEKNILRLHDGLQSCCNQKGLIGLAGWPLEI